MKQKTNYKLVCSNCGSTNVSPFLKYGLSFKEVVNNYCKDCNSGYPLGGFFPEVIETQIERFQKRLKKQK